MGTVIVIATYNEAETIGQIIEALPYPAIVVDDNSPDGTGRLARKAGATVIVRQDKQGIASAYHAGLRRALDIPGIKHVIQMDAGLTHEPGDAGRLIVKANWGDCDLVIGSRFIEQVPWNRRSIISRTAALMMWVYGIRLHDVTSGFRFWDANLLRQVTDRPFRATGFAFQLEALYRAHRAGAHIGEAPIEYRLTNSSFRPGMLIEGLRIWATLALSA